MYPFGSNTRICYSAYAMWQKRSSLLWDNVCTHLRAHDSHTSAVCSTAESCSLSQDHATLRANPMLNRTV